ncbi:T9SS type A sorting domain-containing protein [bacterium]|nr:T9SS type A sorting domain-containing protein [bacterium]
MKIIYLLIPISALILLSFLPVQAQLSLERQVLAAGGDVMRGNTLVTSATLGETATLTLSSQNLTLTQGFQQPWTLVGTPVEETLRSESFTAVYPNPTSGEVTVDINGISDEDVHILLTDILGRPVAEEIHVYKGEDLRRCTLDLTSLPSGFYLVSFFSEKEGYKEVVTVVKK